MVRVPDSFLAVVGCNSCIWKSHGFCPHGLVDDEVLPSGDICCSDFSSFLQVLGDECNSVIEFKERFFLYCQELEVLSDRKRLSKVVRSRDEFLKDRSVGSLSNEELKKLSVFDSEIIGLKLWWSRLNDSLIKALSRVVDRESRERVADKRNTSGSVIPILSVQSFNKLLKGASDDDSGGG